MFGCKTTFGENKTAKEGYDSFPGKGIVIVHGHGAPGVMQFDKSDGTWTRLYASQQSSNAGFATLNNYAAGALSKCELMMFLTCHGGTPTDAGLSMVQAAKNKGAKVVIGFTVSVSNAEHYTKYFMGFLQQGYTVQRALEQADTAFYDEFKWELERADNPANSAHRLVLGNTNTILK